MIELLHRLESLDLTIKPQRGLPGTVIETFPSVWAIEGAEDVNYEKPGLYRKILPVSVDYYVKGVRAYDCYVKGNAMLQQIYSAIEIDERFTELCTLYHAFRAEVVYYNPPIESVCAAVGYKFYYVERFRGDKNRRTI
jgi:hypothetical protein